MPAFDTLLAQQVATAAALARAGEIARAAANDRPVVRREFRSSRIEALYEMAYIRLFVAWEAFLEATFFRYMCGYTSVRFGQATMVAGPHLPSINAAEGAFLGGQNYFLWHSPTRVQTRTAAHVKNGRHEQVVSSNSARLEWFAQVRHRIVHGQNDARTKFDLATMNLAGRRYPASSPGKFLRDLGPGQPVAMPWLDIIGTELTNLAAQII